MVKKLQLFFNYKYNMINKFLNDVTVFFLTIIGLPHSLLWVMIEGTASLTQF